jgi:hypothetical protein
MLCFECGYIYIYEGGCKCESPTTRPPPETNPTPSLPDTPEQPSFILGNVTGSGTISIADALEVLKYTADMPSIIDECSNAFFAAMVISEEEPGIADALEIMKYVADMPNVIAE